MKERLEGSITAKKPAKVLYPEFGEHKDETLMIAEEKTPYGG